MGDEHRARRRKSALTAQLYLMRLDAAQDVIQREPGSVADQPACFGQVWSAVTQILEILAVNPAVGNMYDLHGGIHQAAKPLGQFANRNPFPAPYVDPIPAIARRAPFPLFRFNA